MGNVANDEVCDLIARLPGLCADGSTVIWTRHRRPPDLTPAMRVALADAGFSELSFHALESSWATVGSASLARRPDARRPDARVPDARVPDSRARTPAHQTPGHQSMAASSHSQPIRAKIGNGRSKR